MDKEVQHNNKNKKTILVAALLILMVLTGCGKQKIQRRVVENLPKTGALSFQYFYTDDCITMTSTERIMYSEWEPVEFDYICTDPSCSHLIESCSARTIERSSNDFSIVYRNRLIILHSYFKSISNIDSENNMELEINYYTDVYEADLDGSNRSKKLTFLGGIAAPQISHAAVLADGKIYFGGPTENVTKYVYEDGYGVVNEEDSANRNSDAVYCLDLNDYTVETFADTQDRAGGDAWMYQLYEFDGFIYAIVSNFQDDCAVWYRIDPSMGECREILRFDSDIAVFCGAIEDTVYYYYDKHGETLYAKDIASEEEKEIMSVSREGAHVIAFILDGKILFQTDGSFEDGSFMSEYALLDRDGNSLDIIHYDDYITFLDVVGNRLIYFRTNAEHDEWWVDKSELANLVENGVSIGTIWGEPQDTLIK